MITFSKEEILNKHGQRIYMFAKQPGNTELEKCINFNTEFGVAVDRYDIDGRVCIVTGKSHMEVFREGEKVGEWCVDGELYNRAVLHTVEDIKYIIESEGV